METLGLSLEESKALLRGVQDFVVVEQVADELERRRPCPHCGKRHTSKGQGSIEVKTVFGPVDVPSPRWHRCACQSMGPHTFRPTTNWLNAQASPELRYLETKWASLIPYAKVAQLLKDVLPVAETLNPETVRNHLHATAERIEQALGDEAVCLFEGSEEEGEQQPLPDGPITVGIDGGYVRGAHKQGWFEVIAGKSVVAFRRQDEGEVLRIRANLRRKAPPALVGADEGARNARKPAGGVHVGWRRECPPGARVPSSIQRASDRLVPPHDAAHRAAAATEGAPGRTARGRRKGGKTAREREAPALARQRRRGARALRAYPNKPAAR